MERLPTRVRTLKSDEVGYASECFPRGRYAAEVLKNMPNGIHAQRREFSIIKSNFSAHEGAHLSAHATVPSLDHSRE